MSTFGEVLEALKIGKIARYTGDQKEDYIYMITAPILHRYLGSRREVRLNTIIRVVGGVMYIFTPTSSHVLSTDWTIEEIKSTQEAA